MSTSIDRSIVLWVDSRSELQKAADETGITIEDLFDLRKQIRDQHDCDWAKAKRIIDAMDDYDFITWWYELEVKNAWQKYLWFKDEIKTRMKNRCKKYLDESGGMIGGESFKLKLHGLYESGDATKRDLFKHMSLLRGHAFLNGIFLAMRVGIIPFSTFELRILSDIRREVVNRFERSRADVAKVTL